MSLALLVDCILCGHSGPSTKCSPWKFTAAALVGIEAVEEKGALTAADPKPAITALTAIAIAIYIPNSLHAATISETESKRQ